MKEERMTIEELRDKLRSIVDKGDDPEGDHIDADRLLLKYINDRRVTKLFRSIHKWYC